MSVGNNTVASLGGLSHIAEVTPADGSDLASAGYLMATDTAGIAKVDTVGGETNVPIYLSLGVFVPVKVKRVRSTDTVAAGIVVGW